MATLLQMPKQFSQCSGDIHVCDKIQISDFQYQSSQWLLPTQDARTELEPQALHAGRWYCRELFILSQLSTNAQKIPMIMAWQMCWFGDQHVAS